MPWTDADEHTGEIVEVCGPLESVHDTGDETFFNLGRAHPDPDRFTIVVWESFTPDVSTNSEICATGRVDSYEGTPQIQYQYQDEFLEDSTIDSE